MNRGMRRNTTEIDELIGRQAQTPANRHVMATHRKLNVVIENGVERIAMAHRTKGDLLHEMSILGWHIP